MQSAEFSRQILPTLKSYIALRRELFLRSIAAPSSPLADEAGDPAVNAEDEIQLSNASDAPHDLSSSHADPPDDGHAEVKVERVSQSPSKASTPAMLDRASSSLSKLDISTPLPTTQDSTRALIARVAHLAEENVRTSEEKVNLAQAAYDSVCGAGALMPYLVLNNDFQIDRQIRLLDQAIKDQETSISLGLRPGTHPTSIVLPDTPITYKRSSRSAVAAQDDSEAGMTLGMPSTGSHAILKGKKRNRKNRGRIEAPTAPEQEVHLSISIPAPGNPDEPRYCFCNQVSFGEVSWVRYTVDIVLQVYFPDDRMR